MRQTKILVAVIIGVVLVLSGCVSAKDDANGSPSVKKGRNGARSGNIQKVATVPVEVVEAHTDTISSFLETNGVLEAENEVNIVARTSGPVVELAAEEGMHIKKGQLLIRLDDTEHRAQVEIATVALNEAGRAHARAKAAIENEIISEEVYDQALAQLEAAKAQLNGAQVQYDYTTITAPFDGIIIERYVKFAENISPNQQLFRISDFDPLLCKIQVPEKELSSLKKGQRAFLNVEAWPGERFDAIVLRISPVVEATTGTIRVTLEVRTRGKLSPGMFASVFLETDTRINAVVIPKRALSLESLLDTVFLVKNGTAVRRELELGYEEEEIVEVLTGVAAGDLVVVVGQDGLTDGIAVQTLKGSGSKEKLPLHAERSFGKEPEALGDRPLMQEERASSSHGIGDRRQLDFNNLTPEKLEAIKKRMRDRGMSNQEIERSIKRRLEQAKQR